MSNTAIKNHFSDSPSFDFYKAIQLIIGSILLIFSLYQAANFPSHVNVILIILAVVFITQLLNHHAWLISLPLSIVLFDFSSYSGRFIFNELDFIVITIIGSALFTQQFRLHFPIKTTTLVPILLSALAISAIDFSELWQVMNEPLTHNPYYSSAYHFKVAKGVLYGLLLGVIFSHQYRENSTSLIKHLIFGGWVASFCMFIVVLWERHTLVPLFNFEPWWAIASSLLDLTSSYRVTGLFSDMHTGGEAIDGIYLLLVPLNIFGFYWFERINFRLMSLLALFMIAYCIMVGFTRATYFSMAISLAVFAGLFYFYFSQNKKLMFRDAFMYLGMLIVSYIIFNNAGYVGLVSFISMVAIAYFTKWLQIKKNLPTKTFVGIVVVLSCIFSIIAIKNHFDSRWVEQSTIGLILLIISLLVTVIINIFSILPKTKLPLGEAIISVSVMSVFAFLIAIALGGTQINARMTTINKDIDIRLNHWQSILASADNSFMSQLMGNGMGTMPLNFVITHPNVVGEIGSFTINDKQLLLGTGDDLAFGQRIPIAPQTNYIVSINAASEAKAQLSIFLCERNIIFASDFMANCAAENINITASQETHSYQVIINSENVGQYGNVLMQWPTMLYLKNIHSESSIKINNINIKAVNAERNLLNNGNFNAGLDHWFFYNDFKHLPWHIKNIYLSIYYQLGVIGILLFFIMIFNTLRISNQDITLTALQIFMISYLVGMFSFGLFGDPLDSARASTPFFMLLFALQFIKAFSEPTKIDRI